MDNIIIYIPTRLKVLQWQRDEAKERIKINQFHINWLSKVQAIISHCSFGLFTCNKLLIEIAKMEKNVQSDSVKLQGIIDEHSRINLSIHRTVYADRN